MRIGMVLMNGRGFPPDIRVEKEARALAEAGHDVFILARTGDDNSPQTEYVENIGATVKRVDIPLRKTLSKAAFALMIHDFEWKEPLQQFVKENHIQILHGHDLHAIPAVLEAGKKNGIPVIADLHENMPAAMRVARSATSGLKRLSHALFWNYPWMRFKESALLRQCRKTIIVVPEAGKRLQEYGLVNEDIVIISNTEDETTFSFDAADSDPAITETYKDKWVASYIGGLGPHRGIDTVLKAVPNAVSKIPDFCLLIVGVQRQHEKEWLKREIDRLKIDKWVEIVGWQPFAKVNSYITASNVCLVPHNDFEHTQTTVPHKLFQYMICQKPVLVSDCAPLKRIVGDVGCGLVFKANNSADMASRLAWMYRHPEELKTMGQKGQEAAIGKYAWRHDARRLVHMYQELEVQENE